MINSLSWMLIILVNFIEVVDGNDSIDSILLQNRNFHQTILRKVKT